MSAPSVREALEKAQFASLAGFDLRALRPAGPSALYWEEGAQAGVEVRHTFVRRDVPLSRRRWQFDTRREHQAALDGEA
ncbi:MAG: hypothetical protein AB1634_15405 [Thermodesulfobacteriota bacterium]